MVTIRPDNKKSDHPDLEVAAFICSYDAVTGAYWYSVSRLMPNSRASPARFSPAATRARSAAAFSGVNDGLRPL